MGQGFRQRIVNQFIRLKFYEQRGIKFWTAGLSVIDLLVIHHISVSLRRLSP